MSGRYLMVQWADGEVTVETNATVTRSVMRSLFVLLRTAARQTQ